MNDDQQNNNNQNQPTGTESKKRVVSTTVTCPHCGQTYETQVEVPETVDTPKMGWEV